MKLLFRIFVSAVFFLLVYCLATCGLSRSFELQIHFAISPTILSFPCHRTSASPIIHRASRCRNQSQSHQYPLLDEYIYYITRAYICHCCILWIHSFETQFRIEVLCFSYVMHKMPNSTIGCSSFILCRTFAKHYSSKIWIWMKKKQQISENYLNMQYCT